VSRNLFDRQGKQAIGIVRGDTAGGSVDVGLIGKNVVENNIIQNVDGYVRGDSVSSCGITVEQYAAGNLISNNTILNVVGQSAVSGIEYVAVSGGNLENTIFDANYITGCSAAAGREAGFSVRCDSSDAASFVVSNSIICGVEYGVMFLSNYLGSDLGHIKSCQITNNVIDASITGVWFNNADPPGAVNPVQKVLVAENNIVAPTSGVSILASESTISSNVIDSNIGVEFFGGSSTNEINNNQILNATTTVNTDNEISPLQLGENYLWVDSANKLRFATADKPETVDMDTAGQTYFIGRRIWVNQQALSSNFDAAADTTEQTITGFTVTLPIVAGLYDLDIKIGCYYGTEAGADNTIRFRVGTSTTATSNSEVQNLYVSGGKTLETFGGFVRVEDVDLSTQTYVHITYQSSLGLGTAFISASANRSSVDVSVWSK
jgi:hypothetical protein